MSLSLAIEFWMCVYNTVQAEGHRRIAVGLQLR